MVKENNQLAQSAASASKTMFAALQFLKKNGGQAPAKEVINYLSTTLTFSDWESSKYEKMDMYGGSPYLLFIQLTVQRQVFYSKKKAYGT